MSKSKFQGLKSVAGRKKADASAIPKMGRPRKTAADSAPITLHMSREIIWDAKAKLAADRDPRPLSAIFEELGAGWIAGKFKV